MLMKTSEKTGIKYTLVNDKTEGYTVIADNGHNYYLGVIDGLGVNSSTDMIIIYELIPHNVQAFIFIDYLFGATFFEEEITDYFTDIIKLIEKENNNENV